MEQERKDGRIDSDACQARIGDECQHEGGRGMNEEQCYLSLWPAPATNSKFTSFAPAVF